ncbi:MAG: SusC/RagA family TonB-linked outer membrane protein [Sphingobacteriales bacterium]|nr:MAG: SusC/RagA family TonB-linked outer membrane protein [Sphingobacteriales bacterium]
MRLATQESSLNEVVVIGYGTARRRDLTGSVATVNERNFNKGVFTSPDQLIQGKVAGVQITNNSGQPGGQATIRIRGASALTGSGNPLFVVDGVPLDNSTARPGLGDVGMGDRNPGANPLNFLNPNDIVSIDVLKDASATAIYGSRGAFGVVLVTTKRGQSGAPKIDFGASVGVSDVMRTVRVLNAEEFRQALTYYGQGNANDKGSNVDAFDAITRTGVIQNYNAAISGGSENARMRLSLGALSQEGILRKSGIKKYTANFSGQFRFLNSRKLGLDINIIPSQVSEDIAPVSNNSGSRGNLIAAALRWNPTKDLVIKRAGLPDSLNVESGDVFNPLALQEAITDKARLTTILASFSPYYKLTDWLEYRFLYSINYGTGTRRTTLQPYINIADVQGRGRALIASNETSTQQFTHTVNINRNLTSLLSLNAVVGYEYLKFDNKGFNMGAFGLATAANGFGYYNLDFTNYIQYSNPTNRLVNAFADPTSELQSYFARAGFNYSDKYLLTATVRRDGSTKFGENNKYGTFPSFSVAWNINRENFFPQISAINSLKIRAGWGKTGNQEFPAGAAVQRYRFDNGTNATPAVNNANPDLKWQSDRQYNIGLDANLFNNRVTLTADYFNKRTTDLLFPITEPSQPALAGAVLWRNIDGNIDNKGFEFAINSSIIRQRDFNLDLGVNATFVTNVVSNLEFPISTGELNGQGSSGARIQVIQSGLPLYAFVTRQFAGIDKATGFSIFPFGDQLFYMGNSLPKQLVGLNLAVRYKALTLTASANGAFGYKIYNETLNNVINVGSIGQGLNIAYSEFTSPDKESTNSFVTNSSRYLENGNFLKLQSAMLSYNLGKIGNTFSGVNIYVTGQNLFVITKYKGFDPEVNVNKNVSGVPSASIEYIPYPTPRTLTFGVNFTL